MADQVNTEELEKAKQTHKMNIQDEKQENTNTSSDETENHKLAPEISLEDLVRFLRGITDDQEFWRLTYMQSTPEFVCLDKEHSDRFLMTPICEEMSLFKYESPLHDIVKCVARTYYHEDKRSLHPVWMKQNFDNPEAAIRLKCSRCVDNLIACPYRAAAYIKLVCENNDYTEEEVYQCLAEGLFERKVDYHPLSTTSPANPEEYEFLDKLAVATAMVFIREKWIDGFDISDSITYSYVDFFKSTRKTMIPDVLDMYRGGGKTEKVPLTGIKAFVQNRRNPSDGSYVQDPDKVAAYLVYLADKYQVSPMAMAAGVLKQLSHARNLYNDVILGIMKSELHGIPFTRDGLITAENVFNYIVNYGEKTGIPYFPVNAIIYSKDEAMTQRLVGIFDWAMHYERYFKGYSIANGNVKTVSLADFELDDIVNMINSIKAWDDKSLDPQKNLRGPITIHITDMDMLPAKERRAGDNVLAMAKLSNAIARKQDLLSVMISGEKEKLERVLKSYSEFYNRIMLHKIAIDDMPVQRIVYELIQNLTTSYTAEEGFEKALEKYVIHRYNDSDIKSRDMIEVVKQEILFNHYNKGLDVDGKLMIGDIPVLAGAREDQDIWKEIDSLQGLDNVKEELHKLQNLLKFRNKATSRGLKGIDKPSLHMIFAGNPGTGKTTVARLLGDLLYNFGYIKQRKLVEVSPKELIAPYVGQTAPRTAVACEAAYGGILFVDEAYELAVTGHGNSTDQFRSECVTELIKQMEDHRDNLVVIFAGYTEEMDKLVESNAGFASRIGNRLTFNDYTDDELYHIYKSMAEKAGLALASDVTDAIYMRIADARELKDFGNARFIRNLFEKTLINHAENTIMSEDDEVLFTITVKDIPDVDTSRRANKKVKLGFV